MIMTGISEINPRFSGYGAAFSTNSIQFDKSKNRREKAAINSLKRINGLQKE